LAGFALAVFMSRMLQNISKQLQWLPLPLGSSTRHERDIAMLELLAWLTLALAVYIAIVVTLIRTNQP
jgi:hypothetical protein